MSVNKKLFFTVGVVLAAMVSGFGAVGYVRKPKRRSTTSEHWLRLLNGANGNEQAKGPKANAGSPAEIIGKAGYTLYKD